MVYHVCGAGTRARAVTGALEALGLAGRPAVGPPDEVGAWIGLDESASGIAGAEEALRSGWNVLVRWPAELGPRHAERLVALSEEAGRQACIIRPLRRQGDLTALAGQGRATILTLVVDLDADARASALDLLGDLLDTCVSVFGVTGVQRAEVESARGDDGEMSALATSIRFQNGALAQVVLSFGEGQTRFHAVVAGGGRPRRAASVRPVPVPVSDALVVSDAAAFVHALSRGNACPVPLADSIETLRILERVRTAMHA